MKNYEHLARAVNRAKEENIQIASYKLNCNGFYIIEGSRKNQYKVVVKDNVVISCSCPHVYYRGLVCKHMIKVASITDFDITSLEIKKQP